jgi:hypothetical protein
LQLQKRTYNMIGLKFEFSGTRAPHRNRKVKGRSKPSTEESRLCLMTQELCMKFEMDFKTITIATDVCFTIHRIRASGKMCVVRSNKTTYVMLPHLIKSLIEKFGEEVVNLYNSGTLGTPQFKIVRPNNQD